MKKGNISIFVPHLGCPQNCSFCNQRTISGHSKAPDASDVHAAVQAAMQSPGFAKHSLQIAFFGGSFTAIDKSYQQLLLREHKYHRDADQRSQAHPFLAAYIHAEAQNYRAQFGLSHRKGW